LQLFERIYKIRAGRDARGALTDPQLRPFQPERSTTIRIHCLIKINPEHTRKIRDGGSQRQKKYDSPGDVIRDPQSRDEPEHGRQRRDNHQGKAIADVHGAKEVSSFPFEAQLAGGTALVHFWKAPEGGATEDLSRPATWTALMKDVGQQRLPFAHGRYSMREKREENAGIYQRPIAEHPRLI
jgi:hypothetical protein